MVYCYTTSLFCTEECFIVFSLVTNNWCLLNPNYYHNLRNQINLELRICFYNKFEAIQKYITFEEFLKPLVHLQIVFKVTKPKFLGPYVELFVCITEVLLYHKQRYQCLRFIFQSTFVSNRLLCVHAVSIFVTLCL